MHKANVQNGFYITSNEVNSFSSTFPGTGTKMGNFWQPWTGADGELCGHASYLDCFTGIANTYELALPTHDSPQRAEWIGDDYILAENVGSLCDTHTSAQHLDTLSFPSLEQSDEFVFGLNGLISSLPDELLCHIFRFLPAPRDRSACASVSKRWLLLQSHMCHDEFMCLRAVSGVDEAGDEAQSREATRCLHFGNKKRVNRQSQWALGDLSRSLEGKKASDTRLAAVAVGTCARGGLGKLSLRQSIAGDIGLSAIGYCCSALKTLCLWDCPNVEDDGLTMIGKGCGLLEKVDLFRCPLVRDPGLESIAKHCSLLSFMSLDECPSITDKALVAVGEGCSNLLSLSVRGCPLVGDYGIISAVCNLKRLKRMKLDGLKVGDKTLACIGLHAKTMVGLSLANLDLVTEEGFLLLSSAQNMPSLQRFSVIGCRSFGDSACAMMAKMGQGLKYISLVGCSRVSDTGLSYFMQNASSLEVLQLEMCNSITARGLIKVFSSKHEKLKEVKVTCCDGVEDVGILSNPIFTNLSSVKSISITHCPKVTNVFLALIGCLCPHVTSIDFSDLTGISDEGILAFLYSGKRQLTSVNLSDCIEISDRSVCAIAEHCGESVKSFSLDGCKRVTDKGLESVAKYCFVLEDLDVSQCRITDVGVSALLHESGSTLSSLNLSRCRGITERILALIEEHCFVLSDLNLEHCQGLSQQSINLFQSRTWKCNVAL
ncbi:hypothetical protein L7F22_021695 [Adiantum nelumboides]|nr:hypothetical protein [Adiantum nelumboides]